MRQGGGALRQWEQRRDPEVVTALLQALPTPVAGGCLDGAAAGRRGCAALLQALADPDAKCAGLRLRSPGRDRGLARGRELGLAPPWPRSNDAELGPGDGRGGRVVRLREPA